MSLEMMNFHYITINKKHRRIRIGVGETITLDEQLKHPDIKDFGTFLRSSVYDMPLPEEFVRYKDFIAATR